MQQRLFIDVGPHTKLWYLGENMPEEPVGFLFCSESESAHQFPDQEHADIMVRRLAMQGIESDTLPVVQMAVS